MERTYNIPLRSEWLKAPKYRRAKRAVAGVRAFLVKHMKTSEVKIGRYLNEAIWARGIKSPPHHVEVNVTKDDKGVAMAELVGAPVAAPEEVKEAPEAKVAEPPAEVPEAKPVEESKAEQKEAVTPKEAKTPEHKAKAEPTEKKEAKPAKPKAAKK